VITHATLLFPFPRHTTTAPHYVPRLTFPFPRFPTHQRRFVQHAGGRFPLHHVFTFLPFTGVPRLHFTAGGSLRFPATQPHYVCGFPFYYYAFVPAVGYPHPRAHAISSYSSPVLLFPFPTGWIRLRISCLPVRLLVFVVTVCILFDAILRCYAFSCDLIHCCDTLHYYCVIVPYTRHWTIAMMFIVDPYCSLFLVTVLTCHLFYSPVR